MQIESVLIDELIFDPANVRTHDNKNLDAIKGSLAKFGQQKPIVITAGGVVVAGNGTLAAAKALGWQSLNVVRTALEGSDATAYAIADNRTADLAEWDNGALAEILSALQIEDESLVDAAGFSSEELAALVDEVTGITEGNTDPDEVPDVQEEPTAQPGQIWQLGNHRIMCGDSRDPEDVAGLICGVGINVAFTSPPYASQRDYDKTSGFKPIRPDEYTEWFCAVQENVSEHLAPDGSWFVNIKEHCDDGQRSLYVKDLTLAHVRAWGWLFVDELCWQRPSIPNGAGCRFKNEWEPVFHFSKTTPAKFNPDNVLIDSSASGINTKQARAKGLQSVTSTPDGFRSSMTVAGLIDGKARPSNVIRVCGVQHGIEHSAMFPVGLPEFFIKAYSDEDDAIYDPFIGSGTTLIACEQTGRACYGMELSPVYCDVIIKRWEDFTGKTAELVNG